MTDFGKSLAGLRRPRMLVRAARFGVSDYRRARDLRRLLGAVPSPERALSRLIEEEAALEATRRAGAAEHDLRRHLEVMIAMMAEARMLGRDAPPPQMRNGAENPAPSVCCSD